MSDLIPIELRAQLPAVISRRTEIVASTLESIEQKEVMQFFREFPDLGRSCVVRHYPLTQELIRRYAEVLDWADLSREDSCSLVLTEEIINLFEAHWNWAGMYLVSESSRMGGLAGLSCNDTVPWSADLLARYCERLDWISLSSNKKIPWSIDLINNFLDRWDWHRLSHNHQIPWSIKLIDRFRDQIDWAVISENPALPWSEELIEKFISNWDWVRLSRNMSVDWTPTKISRFPEYVPWSGYCQFWMDRLDVPIAKLITEKLHTQFMSILEETNLLKRYEKIAGKDRFLYLLSSDLTLPWSLELIEEFQEHWNWAALSCNPSLPWSEDLIAEFQEYWKWGCDRFGEPGLSDNTGVNWSRSMLDRFVHKWNWGGTYTGGISRNHAIPWSETLIERFANEIDWFDLSKNQNVPWTLDLIEKYVELLDFNELCKHLSTHLLKEIIVVHDFIVKISWLGWGSISRNPKLVCSRDFYRAHSSNLNFYDVLDHQDFGVRKLTEVQVDALMAELFAPKKLKLDTPQSKKARSRARN